MVRIFVVYNDWENVEAYPVSSIGFIDARLIIDTYMRYLYPLWYKKGVSSILIVFNDTDPEKALEYVNAMIQALKQVKHKLSQQRKHLYTDKESSNIIENNLLKRFLEMVNVQ